MLIFHSLSYTHTHTHTGRQAGRQLHTCIYINKRSKEQIEKKALIYVPSGHDVVEVDHLQESLDIAALGNLGLAHALGDLSNKESN